MSASRSIPTPDPAEARCAAWAAGRLAAIGAGALRHERRVADVAAALFDLTADRHRLAEPWRGVLRRAALLHDVGRSLTPGPDHAAVGSRLVTEAATLAIGPDERRALAYLTKFHRGPVPPPESDWTLGPTDDRAAAHTLLGLLRVADALDARNGSAGDTTLLLSLDGDRLTVDWFDPAPPAPARWAGTKRKKFAVLEEALGLTVEVRPRRAEGVRVVG